jgi:hypothetical protein
MEFSELIRVYSLSLNRLKLLYDYLSERFTAFEKKVKIKLKNLKDALNFQASHLENPRH